METVTPEHLPEPVSPETTASPETELITEPLKLIRIASMLQAMRHEVREITLDDSGRRRLTELHSRTLAELREIMSPDLQEEFDAVILPLREATPSDTEIRLAQAQLAGWLEGLFHGIRASVWGQQMAAQQQALKSISALQELQSRQAGAPLVKEGEEPSSGLYL